MYFLWYLLIGLAAGWIASLIFKGSGSGLLVNLIVGLIGGILGGTARFFVRMGSDGHMGNSSSRRSSAPSSYCGSYRCSHGTNPLKRCNYGKVFDKENETYGSMPKKAVHKVEEHGQKARHNLQENMQKLKDDAEEAAIEAKNEARTGVHKMAGKIEEAGTKVKNATKEGHDQKPPTR